MAGKLLMDFDTRWVAGAASDTDPGVLPLGNFWQAENMVSIGGLMSCRPGYQCIASLPEGRLQGGTLFLPADGVPQIVVVVDGIIYASAFPFRSFRMLPNVRMSIAAKQVFWCVAEQSAERIDDTFTSAIRVVDPTRRVLLIQDGCSTPPVWYDGAQSGHDSGKQYGIPAGGPMRWVGDRLWVANGNRVQASDIGNPFSFREQVYLGGAGAFVFPDAVTGMAEVPSVDNPQLLVFLLKSCWMIQANIRARDDWAKTAGFQQEILPVGSTGQRSIVSQYGELTWFSPYGVVSFNRAIAAQTSSKVPVRDGEMHSSKLFLAEDLSLVAGGGFGRYTLMSVPSGDEYNRHTWVYSSTALETVKGDAAPMWNGFWTGTRPVEWFSGNILGQEQIFHVSYDADGVNRLWRAFTPARTDNGCPIHWALFTRGLFGAGSQAKNPGTSARFRYADVALVGIEDTTDIGVWYAGGVKGAFRQIAARYVNVVSGSINASAVLSSSSPVFSMKPQARVLRTADAMQDAEGPGLCSVESTKPEDFDESFQLLIAGQGPATIRYIRAYASLEADDECADPDALSGKELGAQSGSRISGEGAAGTVQQVVDNMPEFPTFTSTRAVTLTSGSIQASGAATATSIISQEAADRAAERAARAQAALNLVGEQGLVLSLGKGF